MPEKDFAHEKLFHKNNSGMEEIQKCYIGCTTEFIPAGLIPTQPTLVTRQYAYIMHMHGVCTKTGKTSCN